MKKTVSMLVAASIAASVYAATPLFNSTAQSQLTKDSVSGAWSSTFTAEHTSETLANGDIKVGYALPLAQGSISEYATYNSNGDKSSYEYVLQYGRNYKDSTASYAYTTDGQLLSESSYRQAGTYGLVHSHTKRTVETNYSYGMNGSLDQIIAYGTTEYSTSPTTEDTTTTTFSYDGQGRVSNKVVYATDSGERLTTTYNYTTNATGETVITENSSITTADGNWKRPEINPVKKYANPGDTLVEEYRSSDNKLVRCTSNSYLNNGDLFESTTFERDEATQKLLRTSRTSYSFE